MFRNFKALGLALAAILALSAIVASAASAQGKLTSDGPVTLTGTEAGLPNLNTGTMFGASTRCTGSTSTGHKVGSPTELIPSGSTTITLTPLINQVNCVAYTGGSAFPMTVTTNGCDSVVHIGGTISTNTYSGTTDIVCPEGKVIVEHVYSGEHKESNMICQLTVKPQTGLTGAQVISTPASDSLDIVGTIKGIHMERKGLCALDGKGTTTTTGDYHINGTVTGRNAIGDPTGITVTD